MLSKENLFVYADESKLTAVCLGVSVDVSYGEYCGLWRSRAVIKRAISGNLTWQTGSQLLRSIFLFTLEEKSRTYQHRRALNSQEQIASWHIMRKKKKNGGLGEGRRVADKEQIGFLENCVSAEQSNTVLLNTEKETKLEGMYVWMYEEGVMVVSSG